jgi:hypothetical protein
MLKDVFMESSKSVFIKSQNDLLNIASTQVSLFDELIANLNEIREAAMHKDVTIRDEVYIDTYDIFN